MKADACRGRRVAADERKGVVNVMKRAMAGRLGAAAVVFFAVKGLVWVALAIGGMAMAV